MRDEKVLGMHQANAARVMLVLRQFEFLMTRQQAMETVVMNSRWYDRLRWLLWPNDYKVLVDAVQQVLLQRAQQELEKAAKKPIIHKPLHTVVPGA